jgi:hypothetical protein
MNKSEFLIISIFLWISSFLVGIPNAELEPQPDASTQPDTSARYIAEKYCSSCHLFPDPSLLDQKTWLRNVLPNMAFRLGINSIYNNPYIDLEEEEKDLVKNTGVYPENPIISDQDWQKIVQYYAINAPEEIIPLTQNQDFFYDFSLFEGKYLGFGNEKIPKTTLISQEPHNGNIIIGDANNELFIINKELELVNVLSTPSAPTHIDFPLNKSPRVLTIGNFAPSQKKLGKLIYLNSKKTVILDSLPRSVHFGSGDLNGDKIEDVVVCGFGNHTGRLFWVDGSNKKENTLSTAPGARKVILNDLNLDGKLDVLVMMAQSNEQIVWYKNLGNAQFEPIVLANFHPLFGLSNFELIDLNQDGFLDLLISNGDNWDFSNVPKNYHGVRIFLNNKKNKFEESWFFPLNGASQVKAEDFDLDGDLDLVATSFYGDDLNPDFGFVYFNNLGNGDFVPMVTKMANAGKWLCMEIMDIDADGDKDIILGSYFHTEKEINQTRSLGYDVFPQLLILKNTVKK